MPFKKGKYRKQGKGKLGRYHATRLGNNVVQTSPAAANSASAAADGVGDNRGDSGVSCVDKSGSAEAIAAATLVSMNPPEGSESVPNIIRKEPLKNLWIMCPTPTVPRL